MKPIGEAAFPDLNRREGGLFQELRKDFPDTFPSLDNLQYSLVKRQFTPDAAEKAAKSYLATFNLVAGIPDSYNASDEADGDEAVDDGSQNPPPPPPPPDSKVKVMQGERVVFTEEMDPQNYVKLIASGEVDESMLDALQDYVRRQKKRLGIHEDITAEARKRAMGPE